MIKLINDRYFCELTNVSRESKSAESLDVLAFGNGSDVQILKSTSYGLEIYNLKNLNYTQNINSTS